MMRIENYIDGDWAAPAGQQYFENINPATGQIYSRVPDSGTVDVSMAVDAAKAAFKSWSKTSLEMRFEILMRIVRGIEEQREALAEAESRDNGKPLWLARKVDIPRAASNFRFFATALMQFASESHEMPGNAINYTLRRPIGVVGCISPWNLPLYLFTWKIAPAIAAGNCVVGKPSEITPMTAYMLADICMKAGLPPGVLNIVHGRGNTAGAAIVEHPEIKAISFTGGTQTGAHIASVAAPMFKKLSLELGGKNPNIIFDDCDYDKMLKTTLASSFANQGQICLCGSRIFIQRPLYERFKNDFVTRVSEMKLGDPMHDTTRVGAVVSEAHMNKILSYISLAKEEGGKILTGGERVHLDGDLSGGYYIRPTVIENLDAGCRVNQEEIFGPVVSLMPFDTEKEVLQWANSTPYGLAASIWTSDLERAHRLAGNIDAGVIWINCWLLRDLRTPFGGMKQSGVGREGGFEAMRFFTEARNICVDLST